MPYVNVPNDLSKIKTKLAFNLTKRQLICFGGGAAVGIPAYLLTRSAIGSTGALFVMLGVMLPAFLLAMYESIIVTLLAIVAFIAGQTSGGIVFLVLAFLVSPYGLPAMADWLIEKMHALNYALRDFITS